MATMNITAMATHRSSRLRTAELSRDAIDVALQAFRQPTQFHAPPMGSLPPAMKDVIRAAAGDEHILASLSERCGITADYVKEASQFYLRKLLTSANGNNFRKLALDPSATPQDIKDHKRLLLMWLHPDRNPNLWEAKLFKLVRDAAENLDQQDLKSPSASEGSIATKHTRRAKSHAVWQHAGKKQRQVNVLAIVKSAFRKLAMVIAILMIAIFGTKIIVAQNNTGFSIANFMKW
jgi:hypothetical protein